MYTQFLLSFFRCYLKAEWNSEKSWLIFVDQLIPHCISLLKYFDIIVSKRNIWSEPFEYSVQIYEGRSFLWMSEQVGIKSFPQLFAVCGPYLQQDINFGRGTVLVVNFISITLRLQTSDLEIAFKDKRDCCYTMLSSEFTLIFIYALSLILISSTHSTAYLKIIFCIIFFFCCTQ